MAPAKNKRFSYTRKLTEYGIGIAGLLGAQSFVWMSVHSAAVSYHEQRTQQEQIQQMDERLQEIKGNYEENKVFIDQLSVQFPSQGSVAQIVERLEQLGEANQIRLTLTAIGEEAPLETKGHINLLPLSVTVEAFGQPDQLLTYLDGVEHVQEVTRVESWTLEPVAPTQPGAPIRTEYQLNMKVLFYFQSTQQ